MSHLSPSHLRDLHLAAKDEVARLSPNKHSSPPANALSLNPKRKDERLTLDLSSFQSPAHPSAASFESDLPTASECAIHLELLEVFYNLRHRIINSTDMDTTFGVKIKNTTVYRRIYQGWGRRRHAVMRAVKLKDATWPDRRRKKWQYFLEIAAGRFRAWAKKMDDFLAAGREPKPPGTLTTERTDLRLPCLPPLDILMVWHALLLNPLDYDKYLSEHDLRWLHRCPFPWEAIHQSINSRDWSFSLAKESEDWVRGPANMEPDLFHYLIKAGKTTNAVSSTLAKFGKRVDLTYLSSLGNSLDKRAMPDKCAFLDTLREAARYGHETQVLVSNVQRQASFVDKMHIHLWIRSPAVEGTIRRARGRYNKFLRLFKLYPGKTLVPTLDIDLVWHTHQCSALGYKESMLHRTGVFINHDDKIGKSTLDSGMEETKILFLTRFGQQYSTCLCWDCEAAASVVEGSDEDGTLDGTDVSVLVEKVRKDVEHYRAVEIARRSGQALPAHGA